MLLIRTNNLLQGPGAWTARTDFAADADQVLRALTVPALIARWAPVDFEVEGLAGGRLRAGARERVSGTIAGVRTAFDVEVTRADTRRLELTAQGPVGLEVSYAFTQRVGSVGVEARVAVSRGRGFTSQLLVAAVSAILNAGALSRALSRLEASLAPAGDEELAMAA